jgi:hypothetical protein
MYYGSYVDPYYLCSPIENPGYVDEWPRAPRFLLQLSWGKKTSFQLNSLSQVPTPTCAQTLKRSHSGLATAIPWPPKCILLKRRIDVECSNVCMYVCMYEEQKPTRLVFICMPIRPINCGQFFPHGNWLLPYFKKVPRQGHRANSLLAFKFLY